MHHSKENPLPPSWFSVDIKLGSLTLSLEEDKWIKAVVNDYTTNFEAQDNNNNNNNEPQAQDGNGANNPAKIKNINLGMNLMGRVL